MEEDEISTSWYERYSGTRLFLPSRCIVTGQGMFFDPHEKRPCFFTVFHAIATNKCCQRPKHKSSYLGRTSRMPSFLQLQVLTGCSNHFSCKL